MRELLIGCGNRNDKRIDPSQKFGWQDLTTLDHDPNCGADVVWDLDEFPWPFEDSTFDEVHAYCVLEHLGRQGDYRSFFATFAEIYRVLKPGGYLCALVPHRLDKWAWGDPSHTRIIQPETLVFLDQRQYHEQIGKTPMTDFRWLWQGDFEPVLAIESPEAQPSDFFFALKAHKPARSFS